MGNKFPDPLKEIGGRIDSLLNPVRRRYKWLDKYFAALGWYSGKLEGMLGHEFNFDSAPLHGRILLTVVWGNLVMGGYLVWLILECIGLLLVGILQSGHLLKRRLRNRDNDGKPR